MQITSELLPHRPGVKVSFIIDEYELAVMNISPQLQSMLTNNPTVETVCKFLVAVEQENNRRGVVGTPAQPSDPNKPVIIL